MEGGSKSKKSRPATSEEAVAATEAGSDVVGAAATAAGSSRPYYECGFCKHGFTTAQALGGHMNIHRRDRARRPGRDTPTGISSAASRNTERYNQYRDLAYPPAPPMNSSFAMYYSGAPSVAGDTHDHDPPLGLGCHGHGAEGSSMPEGSEWQAGETPESKLDLELRLGSHPGWQ